jgi:ribonuclease T1
MKKRFIYSLSLLIMVGLLLGLPASPLSAERCEEVVKNLNRTLHPKIDEKELFVILKVLNETENQRLPPKFVTKEQARKLGWKPGSNLWSYDRLKGKSIGGDVFGNREGKLPNGKRVWREGDLDYKGGRRGAKRIVYSGDGLRMITVDHYKTFKEVPPCE